MMSVSTDRQAFKILLDRPTSKPALGFERIATALAALIVRSDPQFAVGIFGDWGSGKTTLMEAIRVKLADESSVVTVEFNAWRYEREAQILVPLLDTVRMAIVDWSAQLNPEKAKRIRMITARISGVVRALCMGISGEIGIPGGLKIGYDMGKTLEALNSASEQDRPQSLYFAAFQELAGVIAELRANGVSRVVIFIDDLDRCLPENALEVLESIKLFFDLVGFIFVVGLNSAVVDRAVRSRFDTASVTSRVREPVAQGDREDFYELERHYIEKIFQVPYRVPAVLPDDLNTLLESMFEENSLDASQREEFSTTVRPYLDYVASIRRVNPREIKRFLNAYTLQIIIRQELDSCSILALQTLSFRRDWEYFYNAAMVDSTLFLDALQRYRSGDVAAFEDVSPELTVLPGDLAEYLQSSCLESLSNQPGLDPYLSSLELTREKQGFAERSYQQIGRLRGYLRAIRDAGAVGESDGMRLASLVAEAVSGMDVPAGSLPIPRSLSALVAKLSEAANELSAIRPSADPSDESVRERILAVVDSMYELTNGFYKELRALRSVYE
jgi:hypothetical protein